MIKELYYALRWFPTKIYNSIVLQLRRVKSGTNLKILGRIFIRGKGEIIIGDDVVINSCLESNPIGGSDRTTLYVKESGRLIVGNNVGISNSSIYCESTVRIEDNVLIGNGCKIYDSNFHSTDYRERLAHKEIVKSKPILIKENSFIGAQAIVLKGVTIGARSIVAAGSVVVKSIPDDEVWGGNPAVFIKKIEKEE